MSRSTIKAAFDNIGAQELPLSITPGMIADALNALLNEALLSGEMDETPTGGSTNPVTSGGVKTALDAKQNTLTFDSTPTANSTNPVTSEGVFRALINKVYQLKAPYSTDEKWAFVGTDIDGDDGLIQLGVKSEGEEEQIVDISHNNIANLIRALHNPDSTPTASSEKLVTSGGVKAALDYKLYKGYMKFHDVALTSGKFNPILATVGFEDIDKIECYGFVQNTTGADKTFGELCETGYRMAGGSTIIPAGAYFTFGVFTTGTNATAVGYCRLIAVYSQS